MSGQKLVGQKACYSVDQKLIKTARFPEDALDHAKYNLLSEIASVCHDCPHMEITEFVMESVAQRNYVMQAKCKQSRCVLDMPEPSINWGEVAAANSGLKSTFSHEGFMDNVNAIRGLAPTSFIMDDPWERSFTPSESHAPEPKPKPASYVPDEIDLIDGYADFA